MARNSGGNFSLLNTLAPPGTQSNSTNINATMDDIAAALSDSINKDGTKPFAANQPVGGFKFTGLGAGTAVGDAVNVAQVQAGRQNWAAAGGTADAITGTYAPAPTAVTDGDAFFVRAGAANATTTPTFTPNSGVLTARVITKKGGVALAAGDIAGSGHELELRYFAASTRYELMNPAASGAVAATNAETLTGTDNAKFVTPAASYAQWGKGAAVASAGVMTIGDGGYIHVTGTTTITDIDFTVATDGRPVEVIFDGILTLTHNGTTLQLPGAANITTAAGDRAGFRQDAGDNVICTWYTRANGQSVTGMTLLAKVASTSGTSIDFLSIPSWAKRITVMFDGVSTNGTALIGIQIGPSGGVETTGYKSGCSASTGASTATTLFQVTTATGTAATTYSGRITLDLMEASTNTWTSSGNIARNTDGFISSSAGVKSLAAVLDRVRILSTDTFDAGSISAMYEG